MNHEAIIEEQNEHTHPIVDHLDVGPYAINHSGKYVDRSKIESSVLKDFSIYTTVPKLLVRFLAPNLTVAKDSYGYASTNLVYHVQCGGHVDFLCGVLSSKLLSFWYFHAYQNDEIKFPHVQQSHLQSIPMIDLAGFDGSSMGVTDDHPLGDWEREVLNADPRLGVIDSVNQGYSTILNLSTLIIEWYDDRNALNTNLSDYLGNYQEGPNLPDLGLFQPTSTGILDATSEDREKLNVGEVQTERDGSSVTIYATARYKPEDKAEHETDKNGYTETDFIEAFTLDNLSENEAALVESFVPVAVEESQEFAGFRDNATKTISLIDRLKAIRLPDPEDVADDLRRYVETKERADELDEKIEKTDELINEIVYDLYDLTDEEIEIVEEAVGNE